ncbi:L-Aspartase-like protein [Dactylonectria estremocensis]|uniref:L-Aspartase-like protein n=1 Tax=Dactylonectria estremocensis TaxID=1079267 RepID=A0A9P9DCK5_9HYPO|nr:L-Aspartase-like protein [Dactylonectria estremocensis]
MKTAGLIGVMESSVAVLEDYLSKGYCIYSSLNNSHPDELRGHSGVRLRLVEAILHMLRKGMTPIVPLGDTTSASSDLVPLSYVMRMLEGNLDIYVGVANSDVISIVSADEALERAGLQPFTLGPKEGLGS